MNLILLRVSMAALAVVLGVALFGCVGVTPLPDKAPQSAVRSAWGGPSVRGKTQNGERWTYSTAPMGRRVWLLDFDTDGHLVSLIQGLTIERILKIQKGWSQADVEAQIGPSYWSLRYPFRPEELVHIYRFDDVLTPMCFYVGYDDKAVVTSTGMQPEEHARRRIGRPC